MTRPPGAFVDGYSLVTSVETHGPLDEHSADSDRALRSTFLSEVVVCSAPPPRAWGNCCDSFGVMRASFVSVSGCFTFGAVVDSSLDVQTQFSAINATYCSYVVSISWTSRSFSLYTYPLLVIIFAVILLVWLVRGCHFTLSVLLVIPPCLPMYSILRQVACCTCIIKAVGSSE